MIAKRILSLIISASLLQHPPSAIAAAPSDDATRVEAADAVSALLSVMDEIDRSLFDLDVLLESLDYDAAAIVKFVTERIQYEPYPGLLRGPRGTLASGSGNTLDQSVLLAKLLKDAGYSARVVRANLEGEDARRLVVTYSPYHAEDRQAVSYKRAPEAFVSGGDSEWLQMVAEAFAAGPDRQADATAQLTALASDVEGIARLLGKPLRTVLNEELETQATQRMVEEARDYFYVDVFEDETKAWHAVHPALPADHVFETEPLIKEYLLEVIPTELMHRVSVQAFIEQKRGPKLIVTSVSDPVIAPSANIAPGGLEYRLSPGGLSGEGVDTREQIEKAIDRSEWYIPTINGIPAPGAQGFYVNGNTFPIDVMDLSKMALFKTVGDKFSSAAGGLTGPGVDGQTEPLLELNRHWLELKILAPNGGERTFIRTIYDRSRDAADHEKTAALNRTMRIGVLVGHASGTEVLFGYLDSLVTLIRGLADKDGCATGSHCDGSGTEDLSRVLFDNLFLQFDFLSRGVHEHLPDGKPAFRYEPTLLVHSVSNWTRSVEDRIDIVSAGYRSVRPRGAGTLLDFRSSALRGISDSLIEGRFLLFEAPVTAASELLKAPTDDWRVVSGVSAAEDPIVVRSVAPEANLELRSGYTLLMTAGAGQTEGTRPGYWWRITPEDGTVIGVLPDGTGGAISTLLFGAPASETAITTTSGAALTEVAKYKLGKVLTCLGITIAIAMTVGLAIKALLAPVAFTVKIAELLVKLGAGELAPTATSILARKTAFDKAFLESLKRFLIACVEF